MTVNRNPSRVGRIKQLVMFLSLLTTSIVGMMPTAAFADNTGYYAHNARGGLRLGVAYGDHTEVIFEDSAIVKNALDIGWDRVRNNATSLLTAQVRAQVTQVDAVSIALAGSDMAELRTMGTGNGFALKYVLHENKIWLTKYTPWPLPDVSFVVNLDIEVVLLVQSSPDSPFTVVDASAYVRNAKIDGDGLAGDVVKPIIDTFFANIQGLEAQINGVNYSMTEELTGQLAPVTSLLNQIPVGVLQVSTGVDPHSGKISVCLQVAEAAQCAFPGAYEEPYVRSVLDTSIDRCGRPVVWLWDVEKAAYIPIHKGDAGVEVEVNWEFPWHCGWDDDLGDEERAAGPKETQAVRVWRESDGRRIDWQFLYWR